MDKESQIIALRYAIYVCESKRLPYKTGAYIAALDELKLSFEAAIERLENGEQMESIAYTDSYEPD